MIMFVLVNVTAAFWVSILLCALENEFIVIDVKAKIFPLNEV
jgi:hypothetical protein